nr:myoblast city protein homolog - Caenorhabditis elegans [Caenorhabditis elegans]
MATTGFYYAIVQYTFEDPLPSCDAPRLELFIGDRICVYGQHGEWGYGRKFDEKNGKCGIFPLAYVQIVQKSMFVSTSDGYLVVDEISRVINEWWTKIKELMVETTRIGSFEDLMDSFNELLIIKTKIESGGIPIEELSKLRLRVSKLVDRGNTILGQDVVIRNEEGVPLDVESLSLLRTYEAHISSKGRVGSLMREKPENVTINDSFSLLLSIKSVELHCKYSCEISISLYDLDKKMFTTDSYTFLWNSGSGKHTDLNLKALFTDFAKEDIQKKYLMVTRVVHVSPIESSNATMRKHGHHEATIPKTFYCRQSYASDIMEMSSIFLAGVGHEAKERVIFLNREPELPLSLKAYHATNRIPKNLSNDMETKLLISTQLVPGNVSQIKARHPHLFSRCPAAILRRADRTAVSIEDSRNEMYITLMQAELSGKSSDRNIEARLHVVESNGHVMENVFETISVTGSQLSTVYKSIVVYHTDKPMWTEPIKIALPSCASHDVYLRILFYSKKAYDKPKPEKGPFAIAHVQLIRSSALLCDGEHDLAVYKIDNPGSHFDESNVHYMNLPDTRRTLKESIGSAKPHSQGFSLSDKSFVMISTHSCSSMLTQNEHLLNVLRWRVNCVNLTSSLVALAQPIGDTEHEMIRFFSHLLDALFEIWHDRETSEKVVFDVIVAVLRICEEPRHYPQAAKIFEVYLKRFSFTSAALKILKCLNHYVISDSEDSNEKARNAFKVMGPLFKLVVVSKKCGIKFEEFDDFEKTYKQYLREFMKSLVALMSEKKAKMTVQNTALKSIPTIIDLLNESDSVSPENLCGFIVDLMNNFGSNIVTRERLNFIAQIVETRFFSLSICREQLLIPCLQIALDIIQIDNMATEKGEFADRAAECASIIAAILERLFADAKSGEGNAERELTSFILMVYRPLVQAMIRVIHDDKHTDDDARGHFFSVILALLDKMSAQMFSEYVEERSSDIDKRDFLMEMVQMIRDLLNRNAFPSTWKDMIMLQNKVIHKSLRFVMSAVQTFFSNDKFCVEMWREYMVTVVSFVTQEGLNSKHEWMKNEDEDMRIQLRKAAAKDLRSMWFRLTPSQKLNYIPSMIGSFLKVSLVDDDETREATIPIFFDMMQTEYNTSASRSFTEFASELVSQLDTNVDQHSATKGFKEHFRQLSITLCQSDKELMANGGEELIERIDRLLTALIEYHEVASKSLVECVDSLMSRTVQLMRYYNQYSHKELYVKYIYKLYDLHTSYGNKIEAAKTLLRHATMLTFDDDALPQWLIARSLNRHRELHRQLKEDLMEEAGNLFSKGEDWEDALIVYNQLVPVYQNIIMDYDKLAGLLQKIAQLYTSISRTERAYFYYYLVAFYGQGFPAYLNGHKFVFRSEKLEMHGEFMQRIMKMYDNPEKIMKTDPCPHLVDSPGRYIQVFNIDPIGTGCSFENNPEVKPVIKKYFRYYNIQTFEYSKVEERKDTKWTSIDPSSEFMRNWLVRRRIKTADSLPTDLRFTEIVELSDPIYVTPLQNAVEQMRKKNKELNETAASAESNPNFDLKLLSRDILGVVSAAVMGGVKNYEVFFTEACRNICECGEQSVIMELSSLIIEQVEILEYCCYVHASRCQGEARAINTMLPTHANIRLSSFDSDSINDGMMTMKSGKAAVLGNAVANLIYSNKRSSGPGTPVNLSSRSAPSFDNISSKLRSSLAISKLAPPPRPPNPISPINRGPSSNYEGIRMRAHSHQASTVSLNHMSVAPPLPPRPDRPDMDPNRTLKRKN